MAVRTTLAMAIASVALVACGGGGGGGAAAPGGESASASALTNVPGIPQAALGSVSELLAYVRQLIASTTDNTGAPATLKGVTALPGDDTAKPAQL